MIWEGFDQTSDQPAVVCRWPLGHYFKKENLFNEYKKCSKRFFLLT